MIRQLSGDAMKRLALLILSTALLGVSPAWAMRAHDYIDADQRAKVTLPGEQEALVLTVAQQPQAAATSDAALLATPEQAQNVAARPVVSPVPEPSGYAMLGLGLLLLLLKPSARHSEAIPRDPDKHYSL